MRPVPMVTHNVLPAKDTPQSPHFTGISVQPIGYVTFEPALAQLTPHIRFCSYCRANTTPIGTHPVGTICLLSDRGGSHGICDECALLWPNNLTPWIDAYNLHRRMLRAYDASVEMPQ